MRKLYKKVEELIEEKNSAQNKCDQLNEQTITNTKKLVNTKLCGFIKVVRGSNIGIDYRNLKLQLEGSSDEELYSLIKDKLEAKQLKFQKVVLLLNDQYMTLYSDLKMNNIYAKIPRELLEIIDLEIELTESNIKYELFMIVDKSEDEKNIRMYLVKINKDMQTQWCNELGIVGFDVLDNEKSKHPVPMDFDQVFVKGDKNLLMSRNEESGKTPTRTYSYISELSSKAIKSIYISNSKEKNESSSEGMSGESIIDDPEDIFEESELKTESEKSGEQQKRRATDISQAKSRPKEARDPNYLSAPHTIDDNLTKYPTFKVNENQHSDNYAEENEDNIHILQHYDDPSNLPTPKEGMFTREGISDTESHISDFTREIISQLEDDSKASPEFLFEKMLENRGRQKVKSKENVGDTISPFDPKGYPIPTETNEVNIEDNSNEHWNKLSAASRQLSKSGAYGGMNTSNISQTQAKSELSTAIGELHAGFTFIKYGRYGNPHSKLVNIDDFKEKIIWKNPRKPMHSKYILIKDIVNIVEGREGKNFKKYPTAIPEKLAASFSIISNKRELDLEGRNKEDAQNFLKYLKILMENKKIMTPVSGSVSNYSQNNSKEKNVNV